MAMATLYPGAINDFTLASSVPANDADATYAAWGAELGVDPAAGYPLFNVGYPVIAFFNMATGIAGPNTFAIYTANYIGWYRKTSLAPVGGNQNGNTGITLPQYGPSTTIYVPSYDKLDYAFFFCPSDYTGSANAKMQQANGITIIRADAQYNNVSGKLLKWTMRFNADGTFVFVGGVAGGDVPLYLFNNGVIGGNGTATSGSVGILAGTIKDGTLLRIDGAVLPPSISIKPTLPPSGYKRVNAVTPAWAPTSIPLFFKPNFDYINGGDGIISGTVKLTGTPNTPAHRKVRLLRDYDSRLMRETWSDPVSGAYSFSGIDRTVNYTVLGIDYTHNFRAVVADNLTADKMP